MSGRGKGGKGLGKGGAKRHRKVLRDNIQGKHTHPVSLGSVARHDSLCLSAILGLFQGFRMCCLCADAINVDM